MSAKTPAPDEQSMFSGPEIHIFTHVQTDGTISAVQVAAFGRVQRIDLPADGGLGALDLERVFQALCLRALTV